MEIDNKVYLSLGSNLGDKKKNLEAAILAIEQKIGKVLKTSSVYESKSWGYESDNTYYNNCILISTTLSPREILQKTQEIESQLGRVKTKNYTDRTIDIDILLYNDLQIEEENLIIPHPFLTKRIFVLAPLNEITPQLIIPQHFLTIQQYYYNHIEHQAIMKLKA